MTDNSTIHQRLIVPDDGQWRLDLEADPDF
jgi:hypothetical protein